MKAALATPDGISIWKGHFGQSPSYLICEYEGHRWMKGEMRQNPIAQRGDHAHPEEIYTLLSDCRIFAARGMGKKSRRILESKGILAVLKEVETVDEMLFFLPQPEQVG